ncbi:MAG: hypothetical protein CVU22_06315 [Betaproteobacteria bacterium HGW-Betaproteobacteria-16]|nr:MAG: hypothetical protein CVU22_06315 [Betaproteobacteria bacterium HGW-Betaproteobacteria-16]
MLKNIRQKFAALVALVAGLVAAPAVFAQAALPAGVDAAITESGEILVLGATAVIIAMVSFWALKKLGTKMGWW